MTVRKLSDSDKQDILNLYRKPGETTSTLAERYGVSNSTISRLLKSTLASDEYEVLIASKRAARTYYPDTIQTPLFSELEPNVLVAEPLVEVEPNQDASEPTPDPKRPIPRPSPVTESPKSLTPTAETQPELLEIPAPVSAPIPNSFNQNLDRIPSRSPQLLNPQPLKIADPISTQLDEDSGAQASAVAEMLGEDLLDESEDLSDLDDDDEDLEELDEDGLNEDTPIIKRHLPAQTLVQVLPLSEATLPKTCYLVIDRASELITRPLRDFGDLGQIPSQEVQQRTLPVFDNHRVARRFSTKRDRVIKIPDSKLLVDGQVYSLALTW